MNQRTIHIGMAVLLVLMGARLTFGTDSPGLPTTASGNVGHVSQAVLKPWTPVVAAGDSIACWGRAYRWGELPLPRQIITQGNAILRTPMRLKATVAGKRVRWEPLSGSQPASSNGAMAKLSKSVVGSGLRVRGTATVEFDGMVRVDFTVDAPRLDVTVDNLWIEIPLNPAWATLYDYFPQSPTLNGFFNSGAVGPKPIHSEFRPYWWLGNEDGGLCWFAESDRGWEPARADSAIEIVPLKDETTLRLRLWDLPRVVRASKGETFTIGLQATPVKPWPRDWYRQFFDGNMWYGMQSEETWQKEGRLIDGSWFDFKRQCGVTLLCSGDWSRIQAYGEAQWPDRYRTLVAESHRRGMKALPYFGFEISDIAPQWPSRANEIRVFPTTHVFHCRSKDYIPTMPDQNCYLVCYRSRWADFIIEKMKKAKREYGVDGVYLDATATPEGCANPRHGCGYVAKDGSRRPTYPFFAVRDLMKRIREIFPEDRGGVIIAHSSVCQTIPTLGFATSHWDAEHMVNMPPRSHPLETLSLATFRASMMGRNLGILCTPIDCNNKTMTTDQLLALSLLHGVIPRTDLSLPTTKKIGVYYKLLQECDADNARWHPYWNNGRYLATSHSGKVYASFFASGSKKEVLLFVANLGHESLPSASVTLDLAALGLPELHEATGSVWAYGDESGKPIAVQNGTIELSLPVVSSRTVLLRPRNAK